MLLTTLLAIRDLYPNDDDDDDDRVDGD